MEFISDTYCNTFSKSEGKDIFFILEVLVLFNQSTKCKIKMTVNVKIEFNT